ncbi:MAG: hypothetical protein H6625_12145 [Bdellovibrionaceae bacterium]|nr:hypothetical protein [Pseudobdellovibrionaceae bacterium]
MNSPIKINNNKPTISSTICSSFIGEWQLTECLVDIFSTNISSSSKEIEVEAIKKSGSVLNIDENTFKTKIYPSKYFNNNMGNRMESFTPHAQVFSTGEMKGNKVILVKTFQQKGQTDRSTSLSYGHQPDSLSLLSASIKDFELIDNDTLVEIRIGHTYNLVKTDNDKSELQSGPYSAELRYKRKK